MGNSNSRKSLPIDKAFSLPSPIPSWPQGGEFASGSIDLGGGLEVHQITSFNKIWTIYEGGPDDLGATFYEPSKIPDGFFMLGCYSQPNNQPFFGWILVAKDKNNIGNGQEESDSILVKPTDYTLVWSSAAAAGTGSSKLSQDGNGYIWLPVPPSGYRATGYVVTTSPDKPSLDKVRCVRSDLTDECETEKLIWGDKDKHGSVYSSRPRNRGVQAQGVPVGAFTVLQSTTANGDGGSSTTASSSGISCLKNNNFLKFSSMPNQAQVQELVRAYAPRIYFHSKEKFFPSSVNWYFENGALLYTKGQESNPVPIEANGSNLPQGGSNDGNFWIDLPVDENKKEQVKNGDLQSSEAYLQVKPMLGATFTDIAFWIFYPFNGFGTAKLGPIDIPLGRIGEHIGDWEHLTLRISNFNGALHKVYFSEHSKGVWVDSSLLEFQEGSNKPVAYAARNGHPFYPKPGLVLQGGKRTVGIRNDAERSSVIMDTGARYSVVSGDYLAIAEPRWLNYTRKWGPNITYEIGIEVEKVKESLPEGLKSAFGNLVDIIPKEFYGEEGPLGPKMKNSWNGDER